MNLLHKIDLMMRHVEQTQCRVAERLAQQKSRQQTLQETIEGLALQCTAIDRLLEGQKLSDRVIDRVALFNVQRRQAVLGQQRYQLNFEQDRLREEMADLAQAQQQTFAEMQLLLRKQNKFAHWSGVQKRQQMLQRLQREESEIEDRPICMRSI